MSNISLINNIVDRLEKCFHDLGTSLQEYKKTSKLKGERIHLYNNSIKYNISEKKNEKGKSQNSLLSEGKHEKFKYKNVTEMVQSKTNCNLTLQQKKTLRKEILKSRPKPPMNAFIAYVKAQKQRIKINSSANLSIVEVTAIASQQWKALSEEDKNLYIKQYEQKRAKYLKRKDDFFEQNPILKKLNVKKFPQRRQQKPQLKPLKDEQYVDDLKIQAQNLFKLDRKDDQDELEFIPLKCPEQQAKIDCSQLDLTLHDKFTHDELIEITKLQPCQDQSLSNFRMDGRYQRKCQDQSPKGLRSQVSDSSSSIQVNFKTQASQNSNPNKEQTTQQLRMQAKKKLLSAITNHKLQQPSNQTNFPQLDSLAQLPSINDISSDSLDP